MKKNQLYFIDFDSTFTKVEALDELASIVLKDDLHKEEIIEQIEEITSLAMTGAMPFNEALQSRLNLLKFGSTALSQLIQLLKTKVTESFLQQKNTILQHAEQIYIISGGFKDFIVPVVRDFGIKEDHVYANEFIFKDDQVIGYDQENFLAQAKGKVKKIESLKITDDIIVIGDGYTDYEIKEAGLASAFYLFTENITRHALVDKADRVLTSLNELF